MSHAQYHEVPLSLEQHQVKKLMRGHTVQLKPHHVAGSAHSLHLHHEQAKRVHHAKRLHKGVRLALSPGEIEMSMQHGRGIMDWLRNAGNWIKKNVIDTPFYQQAIRPAARTLVHGLADALPVGRDLAHAGLNSLGESTGAFGLRGRGRGRKAHYTMEECSDYQGNLLPVNHPAYQPRILMPPGLNDDHHMLGGAVKRAAPKKRVNKRGARAGGSFKLR